MLREDTRSGERYEDYILRRSREGCYVPETLKPHRIPIIKTTLILVEEEAA